MLLFTAAHAQNRRLCDSVYKNVDTLAEYAGGSQALIKFMNTHIKDAINDCYHLDSTEITGMSISLTISAQGKVLEAVFGDVELAPKCRERLRKRMLGMPTWTPGKLKGVRVCSIYAWLVGGVIWDNQ